MGKTRDLFKKIRHTKGILHATPVVDTCWCMAKPIQYCKVISLQLKLKNLNKKRNSIDLTEAEDINKRGQEYTEELYKKDLNDLDNHDGWSLT